MTIIRSQTDGNTQLLPQEERETLEMWWRAANYLSVGQIYLLDNPLLHHPLQPEHIKPRLVGHWGTTPGLNFIYAHLNRVVAARDLDSLWVVGPGHGGPAAVANAWLEGTYTDIYPDVPRNEEGMRTLFRQFSFPGGIGSHVTAEIPGSIHEGGELGYCLLHAYGAIFDNPDLVAVCVVGDGEAETGPLAASWHSNKFINPARDGAVLPILHLNGYKIANPSMLARIPRQELHRLLEGYGHRPYFVDAVDAGPDVHDAMAGAMDRALDDIREIQKAARKTGAVGRPQWPVIVLSSPKGWTGPKHSGGLKIEGSHRSHQVPLKSVRSDPEELAALEAWLRSYRPEELFDPAGRPVEHISRAVPRAERRISANRHTNAGCHSDLSLPDPRSHAVAVDRPGGSRSEPTRTLGGYLREVMEINLARQNFRIFGPDETSSNRLDAVYEVTGKTWMDAATDDDEHLEPDGRVMEVLSEHMCQGWLEGYLLTGRHGIFNCYEAFIHIVDSMFNQHAKWLKVTREIPWRRPLPSLTYLLSSHVWRQDHNGFSHQDPGFIDHVANKKAEIVRIYLPPDTNSLLVTMDHCLKGRHLINVVVAGKQPQPNWLSIEEAVSHCSRGLGIWQWASNDAGELPDVVLACAGDVPTLETLAAVDLLRHHLPDLRIRVVNVVDLMRLQPESEHPNGLSDAGFDALFTTDRPIIFAFHGYPYLIHRLAYRRTNHSNLHVRGYKEEGTTTTPFDLVMRNDLDRYHLVMDVIDRVPGLGIKAAHLRQQMVDARLRARAYAFEYGEDEPSIQDWTWPS